MRRSTGWALLAMAALILSSLTIPKSYAESNRRIKRNDQTAGQRGGDALAPARKRTPQELARIKQKAPKTRKARLAKEMSPMGALAAGVVPKLSREDADSSQRASMVEAARKRIEDVKARVQKPQSATVIGSPDIIVNGVDDFGFGPTDFFFQSETSIDSNAAGTVLVAGYNDLRGAFLVDVNGNTSFSGVARSTDGGKTWHEVTTDPNLPGLIPVGTGDGQVFGDPDVKWSPTLNGGAGGFIYSSIFVRNSDGVEGMCINISDPNGGNWSSAKQVPPTFRAGVLPMDPTDDDIADKEFIDVNLATGRILMSWTNFPAAKVEEGEEDHDPFPHGDSPQGGPAPAAIQILVTYSDNGGTTWSPAVVVGENVGDPAGGVQSSVPRFLPGTTNANSQAYVTFRIGNSDGTVNIAVNRSTDGGTTWLANGLPIDTGYPGPDQILGNDRVNNSPGMDIDYDTGRVYVTYQRNDALGQGDIALRSFIGAPAVATPILINSNPGHDRTQWFPNISVDQDTGFVHVNFLDQDPRLSGDLTESMNTYSEDQGVSWSPPTPVMDRPFHAGYGNDSSEPNMGDYNQNVSFGGKLHSIWGATSLQPRFDECLGGANLLPVMCTPDSYYDQRDEEDEIIPARVINERFVEAGSCGTNGNLDPGETANFTVPLENYVLNPHDHPATLTGVTASLSPKTPRVTVLNGTSSYPNIPPGTTRLNSMPFTVQLGPTFVPGTYIDFVLTVNSNQGHTQLQFRVATGTPGTTTTLISENFNGPIAPSLPPGWSSVEAGCAVPMACDPWITSDARTPGNQAAFHTNKGTNSEWIRLFSPIVTIPSMTPGVQSYVTVEFDLNYSLEQDPSFLYQAFDGLFLRLTDLGTGTSTIRSVLAEAFAERIRTDGLDHYPKHLPRSNDPDYFADMSVWSGNSMDLTNGGNGTIHVSMKFPGAGMSGRNVQLRFEYTEDSNSNCLLSGGDAPCGIAVDNVVMKHVQLTGAGPASGANLSITKTDNPDPVLVGNNVTYHLVVTNHGPNAANNVVATDKIPSTTGFVSATPSQGACSFASGTVTCHLGSLSSSGPGSTATIDVVVRTRTAGVISDLAKVSSSACDPDTTNNQDTETTTVVGLKSLTFNPSTVTGGCQSSTGTVMLTGPAPPGGVTVKLSTNSLNVHVPSTVVVPGGQSTATFTATTDTVQSTENVVVTATLGPSRVQGTLKLLPVGVASLTLSPNPVHGGSDSIATITLECTPDEDVVVRLTSSRPEIAMPETPITIHAGQMSGQSTIHTSHVNSPINVAITAYTNGGRDRANLQVIP